MSRRAAESREAFDQLAERVPFLRALADTDREHLWPYAYVRTVSPGQPVWWQQDTVHDFFFMVEGHVKLCRQSDAGRDLIVDVVGPGGLLCASAVVSFEPACCTCAVLSGEATVVGIPRRDVLALLERSSAAASAFLRETTGRDVRLMRRMVELGSGHVERRVAALLLRLADQMGEPAQPGWVRIPLKLSRQNIADLCGTTMETAIRTLSRFARRGLVRRPPLGWLGINRAGLTAVVDGRDSACSPASRKNQRN
jgi:CRP/FNR family transcriptional regulator